jgi:transcription elongation factor GreA
MVNQASHLTREGYRKFEAELNYLLTVRRSEVAERLRQALEEGGDLVENAEYEDAKNEQAFVEGRIQYLKGLLSNARIIDEEEGEVAELPSQEQDKVIRLNSIVTIQEEGQEPETYHIVGQAEANPAEGKLSHRSPLGRVLMGKQEGDHVTVEAPDGAFEYVIKSVE